MFVNDYGIAYYPIAGGFLCAMFLDGVELITKVESIQDAEQLTPSELIHKSA